MDDQNPYEPPRSVEPFTPAKLPKREIGAGVILLLTPIAVGIAIGCSCTAANYVTGDLNTAIMRGILVAFVPPAVVLIAMIMWALWAFTRDH